MMQPKLLAVATCKGSVNESAQPSPTLSPFFAFPSTGVLLQLTNRACVRDLAFLDRKKGLAQMTSQMSSAA